mgnify:CR=1 FL=1
MVKRGHSLTLSASSNSAESEPKRFWLFFLWLRYGGKQKKHKKIGKNNRGWGKFRHFVGVGKNKEERKNI